MNNKIDMLWKNEPPSAIKKLSLPSDGTEILA